MSLGRSSRWLSTCSMVRGDLEGRLASDGRFPKEGVRNGLRAAGNAGTVRQQHAVRHVHHVRHHVCAVHQHHFHHIGARVLQGLDQVHLLLGDSRVSVPQAGSWVPLASPMTTTAVVPLRSAGTWEASGI